MRDEAVRAAVRRLAITALETGHRIGKANASLNTPKNGRTPREQVAAFAEETAAAEIEGHLIVALERARAQGRAEADGVAEDTADAAELEALAEEHRASGEGTISLDEYASSRGIDLAGAGR